LRFKKLNRISAMPCRSLFTPVLFAMVCVTTISVSGCGGAQARFAKHLAKGQTFLADENFAKARVEFQNALQIAPKDATVRFEMGVVDEKLGNFREAAQFYQGTLDVEPDNVGARARLAKLYVFSGGLEQALELIKPGLERHPDDPALLTVRAAVRSQQKDAAGALDDAERAVRLAPANEDAVAVLSGIYRAQGDTPKAQALLEQFVQRLPKSVDMRMVLAQIYLQESRPADAEAQLLKIVELKPRDKSHRVRLAQFYAQANENEAAERTLRQAVKDFPEEHDVKVSLIEFLAARRSPEAAEAELTAMIAAAPEDYEMKFALAKFYQDNRQPDKAQAIYKGIIDAKNLEAPGLTARDRLATLRLQDNDVPGALALTNQVLAKSPRDDEALLIRGNIALIDNDPRSAIADLRAVLRDQPNASGVLRTLARAHLANGEPAVAEETMRHAVESNPNDTVMRLDFALLLSQLGKSDQAKAVIAELVKQKPDSFEALDLQYRIARAGNDLPTAQAAADAIVALRPKLAMGYLYQGMIAEAQDRRDDALRLYSAAAEAQPNVAEPLEAVVRVLVNAHRIPEAIARLDAVTARYPDTSFALTIKGELLLRTGKTAAAKDAFTQAIARTPKWWAPYAGLARAQVAANEDMSAALATLRNAKAVVDQPEKLSDQLASLFERQGKPDEAIREYEEALRLDPKSEVAANNLAMLLATYKKDGASLDRAQQLSARFANSSNPSFLDTYGWVMFKRGDAAGSVPVLTRVVAKAPDAVLARYHLGMAQSLTGDSADARDNLARAVNSGARFTGLDEAKATLDKLAKLPATAASSPKT
jgi:tetratricopeptide (TPR) repeat protein